MSYYAGTVTIPLPKTSELRSQAYYQTLHGQLVDLKPEGQFTTCELTSSNGIRGTQNILIKHTEIDFKVIVVVDDSIDDTKVYKMMWDAIDILNDKYNQRKVEDYDRAMKAIRGSNG